MMSKFRRGIACAAGLVTLTIVFSITAAAQKDQNVTVVNTSTNPVPVAGNVTVNGTPSVNVISLPSVNIGNTPNVNAAVPGGVSINGTPNVNIANTPTVTLAGGVSLAPGSTVTVVNPNTQPVNGADVEKLARIPYESTAIAANCPAPGNVGACFFNFSPVPVGYRLVVENLAGYYQISPGATAALVGYIEGTAFRIKGSFTAPLGQIDLGGHIQAAFSNPTRFYVDPGEGVFAVASATWSNGNSEMVMSGYLEACSITGCPAVQH